MAIIFHGDNNYNLLNFINIMSEGSVMRVMLPFVCGAWHAVHGRR